MFCHYESCFSSHPHATSTHDNFIDLLKLWLCLPLNPKPGLMEAYSDYNSRIKIRIMIMTMGCDGLYFFMTSGATDN